MKRLNQSAAVLAVAVIASATACAAKPGGAESEAGSSDGPCAGKSLTVAQANPGYPRLPVYVARYGGLFAETGLTVKFAETDAGADAAAALVGGSADVSAGTFGDVLLAQTQGADIATFAATGYEEISNLVIKKSVMGEAGLSESSSADSKIKALKGRTIGVTSPGSSTDILVRAAMIQQGLDPDKDANITPVGASAMAAAFTRGQLDAFMLSSPSADAAAEAGDGVVAVNFAQGEYKPISGPLSMVMNTTPKTAESKGEELACFTDALQQALTLMKDDPEKAKEYAWQEFDGVVERGQFDATIDDSISAFATSTDVDTKTIQERKDFVSLVEPDVADVPVESTYVPLP